MSTPGELEWSPGIARFAVDKLPLYHGPLVKIRLISANPNNERECHEYTISKDLICNKSLYFKAMFEYELREGHIQECEMPCLDGVVSVQSFENLLEWLYTGHLKIHLEYDGKEEEKVTACVELARLADMCHIDGLELELVQDMKGILLGDDDLAAYQGLLGYEPGLNTIDITREHIISAMCLPEKHPVRDILVLASVEGYLRQDNFRLSSLFRECPAFAADLLGKVRPVCAGATYKHSKLSFEDPLSGAWLPFA